MAQGYTAPGFDRVADVLDEIVAPGKERGAAFAAFRNGEPLVDIWAGDAAHGRPWAQDTACAMYSASKGLAALVCNMLYDRGQLDPEAPMQRYWPEFADARVRVRHVLTHSAGLESWDESLAGDDGLGLTDPVAIAASIAAQEPAYVPGMSAGYHALTIGWLEGELVRRITGRSLGTFFAEEVAGPLAIDAWIGMPTELHHRVADQVTAEDEGLEVPAGGRPLIQRLAGYINSSWMRSTELPAAGAIATARGLAGMYVPLAAGGLPLLKPESLAMFTPARTRFPWPFRIAQTFGLGWMRMEDHEIALGPSPETFGHIGAGNNWGFADPTNGIAIGYVKNRLMAPVAGHAHLVKALYDCLT